MQLLYVLTINLDYIFAYELQSNNGKHKKVFHILLTNSVLKFMQQITVKLMVVIIDSYNKYQFNNMEMNHLG